MHNVGVYIGRFQPFHIAHLETVRFALRNVQKLVIVVGSSNQARTVKNPWTSAERQLMIMSCLTDEERARVEFVEARDYLYNDNLWITAIQEKVYAHIEDDADDVVIIGHTKDKSSFYLKLFPQWDFVETGIDMPVDATQIRDLMFHQDKIGIKYVLPASVYDIVTRFMDSQDFDSLHKDYQYLLKYRADWEPAPYPPTFVTTDAVVIGSGHVLVVRRGKFPGRGLIALPGGFLNQDEKIVDSAIRELKEETEIKIDKKELVKLIKDEHVFDHPGRSLRGRTITHALCFNLPGGRLPQVKGSDDADKAWWMPLREVAARENEFFEDHYHIINYFTTKF